MKRTAKIKTTSVNTINKVVNAYGKCPELIKELQTLTPKSFISDILGENHWIVNEHGDKTCILHKGNYAEYFSHEYHTYPNEFEVYVLDMSQVLKSAVALSRNLQYSWAHNAHEVISESQLNGVKFMLQSILNTLQTYNLVHKESK
jgi:hypothetical protein